MEHGGTKGNHLIEGQGLGGIVRNKRGVGRTENQDRTDQGMMEQTGMMELRVRFEQTGRSEIEEDI